MNGKFCVLVTVFTEYFPIKKRNFPIFATCQKIFIFLFYFIIYFLINCQKAKIPFFSCLRQCPHNNLRIFQTSELIFDDKL